MASDAEIAVRRVRLLIPDKEAIFGDAENEYLFTDDDIADFLALGSGNVKWAAGLAKMTVGSSEALILKVIKNYETQTNGATLAREWLRMGQALIEEGKEESDAAGFSYFEIIFPEDEFEYPEGSNRPIGAPLHVSPPWGW